MGSMIWIFNIRIDEFSYEKINWKLPFYILSGQNFENSYAMQPSKPHLRIGPGLSYEGLGGPL